MNAKWLWTVAIVTAAAVALGCEDDDASVPTTSTSGTPAGTGGGGAIGGSGATGGSGGSVGGAGGSGGLGWEIPDDAKFVAPDGDSSNPGTEEEPWEDIRESIGRLSPGDTLVIRGGTYVPNGTSSCGNGNAPFPVIGLHGDADHWTTIMGYPGERPMLYSPDGWQTLYVCNSSYVRVGHLEVHGDANAGNESPVSGVYAIDSHHVWFEDIWSHDNGGCGVCANSCNHLTFRNNRIWGNSHWNPFQTSGISQYRCTNDGGGDNPDSYSNYVVGNLIWDNWIDPSVGEGEPYGVTDGNGIIIDNNMLSGGNGRTLIRDNVIVDNGGPGIMITRSARVDIFDNSLFQNVKTQVDTVRNNGAIGCNGDPSTDVIVRGNIIVPRSDNPNLFQIHGDGCADYELADNVWVRTGATGVGATDIILADGTPVFADPQLAAPTGDWTPVGQAVGRGAAWP